MNGQMEVEAADRGTYLVHGLALDDGLREQTRSAIITAGKYGLASVATWYDRVRLPYASNLYALNVTDGSLEWKYLLAPGERYICVNGQLESSWPVYGVCLDPNTSDGIIASAGTHVELAGGVTVAALDVRTGRVQWKKVLTKPSSKVPPGGRDAQIVGYSFINSVPRTVGGEIVLGDGGRKGGYFAFRPQDSEQELNGRLASPPEKKR
jgi:outer membrane protein assembly factor BamB